VGHGALAERALAPVLPDAAESPFAARVVAEVLGSSGSSSMAAVCAGWLALRHARVPLSDTVAGISVGLVGCRQAGAEAEAMAGEGLPLRYALLTDIQGAEDHLGGWQAGGKACGVTTRLAWRCIWLGSLALGAPGRQASGQGAWALLPCPSGCLFPHHHATTTTSTPFTTAAGDMDYKVAGSRRGLTAVQLDMKVAGLPPALLVEALAPARAAREELMALMEAALEECKEPAAECAMFGSAEINKELLVGGFEGWGRGARWGWGWQGGGGRWWGCSPCVCSSASPGATPGELRPSHPAAPGWWLRCNAAALAGAAAAARGP
jgi:hypothetical protein